MVVRLIENWRTEFKRLWTIQVCAFWGALCGLVAIWPALVDAIPRNWFIVLGMAMPATIAVARLLKQPGTDT